MLISRLFFIMLLLQLDMQNIQMTILGFFVHNSLTQSSQAPGTLYVVPICTYYYQHALLLFDVLFYHIIYTVLTLTWPKYADIWHWVNLYGVVSNVNFVAFSFSFRCITLAIK